MKMLFLLFLLLWTDKEGANAQGKQTYCVDVPSFLIVVDDCNRRNGRGGVVVWKKIEIEGKRCSNRQLQTTSTL